MGRFIVRGSTTKVTLENSDTTRDLRLLGTPSVSISQQGSEMYITGATIPTDATNTVTFDLTQEQTLSLEAGTEERPKACRIQCHFVKNGKRSESFIVQVPVYNTLHDEVIS